MIIPGPIEFNFAPDLLVDKNFQSLSIKMNSCFQLSTEATSKVGVVKVSVFGGSGKSSSVQSESGDSVCDSIRDSWATYFVNSSKLTLPSSSVWVNGCGRGGVWGRERVQSGVSWCNTY